MNESLIVHKAAGASPYCQLDNFLLKKVFATSYPGSLRYISFNSRALQEAKCCREREHRERAQRPDSQRRNELVFLMVWERTVFGPSRREDLCFGGLVPMLKAWSGSRDMSYELLHYHSWLDPLLKKHRNSRMTDINVKSLSSERCIKDCVYEKQIYWLQSVCLFSFTVSLNFHSFA